MGAHCCFTGRYPDAPGCVPTRVGDCHIVFLVWENDMGAAYKVDGSNERVMGMRGVALRVLMPLCAVITGCMSWDYGEPEHFDASSHGLFIVNEGNYQYGNATLSYYDPEADSVANEVFYRANAMKLGDVAQSMTVAQGLGWIVVNHSNVVFAIDLTTFREVGRITGLVSPRYIHFVSPDKAYVTQLWDNRIAIVDPATFSISGYIEIEGMAMGAGSTEQMVQIGRYVYVSCWSYQRSLLKIDAQTDRIVGRLDVGYQPNSIVADSYGRLWVLTDGSDGSAAVEEEVPALYRVDPATMTVEAVFPFYEGDAPSELTVSGDGDRIYWINDDVWAMDVAATRLPLRPVVRSRGTIYYGLTVDPQSGDIYVADAVDYQQAGLIYRFDREGAPICSFKVGVTPGAFCWKTNQ